VTIAGPTACNSPSWDLTGTCWDVSGADQLKRRAGLGAIGAPFVCASKPPTSVPRAAFCFFSTLTLAICSCRRLSAAAFTLPLRSAV